MTNHTHNSLHFHVACTPFCPSEARFLTFYGLSEGIATPRQFNHMQFAGIVPFDWYDLPKRCVLWVSYAQDTLGFGLTPHSHASIGATHGCGKRRREMACLSGG
jgi:hypothetical protein